MKLQLTMKLQLKMKLQIKYNIYYFSISYSYLMSLDISILHPDVYKMTNCHLSLVFLHHTTAY